MAELEPYLSHKDCGVASLGKVPEHWEVYPNTSLRGPFLRPSPARARTAEGEGPRTVGRAKADRPCPSSVTPDGHAALCPSYDLPDGTVVEYEPDTDLRDTEQVPPLEVHKLMYCLQAAGEPLRLRFVKTPHGPYGKNLRHLLRDVEGHLVSGYADWWRCTEQVAGLGCGRGGRCGGISRIPRDDP